MSASSSSVAGTSRRSHTKSRKGCKTCKKRHIRCDETFPQCRNCTKHQVRCDYMDSSSPEMPSVGASDHPSFATTTPEIENILQHWEDLGYASMGDIVIDLHTAGHSYSRADLRLLHHCIVTTLSAARQFTVPTTTLVKSFSIARDKPFLVHAIFAFSSLMTAFHTGSVDAKGLAYQYGGVALKGLQAAISDFTQDNADAVLLTSLILSWQANDWRSWTSLISGIRTVVNSMLHFRERSQIPDIVDEVDDWVPLNFPDMSQPPRNQDFYTTYASVLQHCLGAVESITPFLINRPQEMNYMDQLKDYLRRLQGARPAFSPEEQFNHLYVLRKWIFSVPVLLNRASPRDYLTLVVISCFYGVALEMELLFPNIASVFVSRLCVRPLNEIFAAFEHGMASVTSDMQVEMQLLSFARQAAAGYQHRRQEQHAQESRAASGTPGLEGFQQGLTYSTEGAGWRESRSPGFNPTPRARELSYTSSGGGSPFLGVPSGASDPTTEPTFRMGLGGMQLAAEPDEMQYGDLSLVYTTGEQSSIHYHTSHSPQPPASSSQQQQQHLLQQQQQYGAYLQPLSGTGMDKKQFQ